MFKKISSFLIVLGAMLSTLLAPTAFGAGAVFSDVASNHPHFEAIQALFEAGVIEGYPNNTFRPDQPVNRAEALKIILLGSDILVPAIAPQAIFPDVVHGVWYDRYAAKAKNLSIVRGDDTTGFFRPGDTVNLAEALKILLKTNSIEAQEATENPYADVPADAWFARYFHYAKWVGLLDADSSDTVHPDLPVNRGLLAELMYRLSKAPEADQFGKASYYGAKFHGRTTANGEVFDASDLTAAHRTYDFGTWLKVTEVISGNSVTVRVNDRGPYADNRVIDLSKAAFESIAPLSRGVVEVLIEKTEAPNESSAEESAETETVDALALNKEALDCPEKQNLAFIPKSRFESIQLTSSIPNTIVEGQVLWIEGNLSTNASKVTAFFSAQNDQKIAKAAAVSQGHFSLSLSFPEVGEYDLGVIPGQSGSSTIESIHVLPYSCLQESENTNSPTPAPPTFKIEDGEGVIEWEKGEFSVFQLTFEQGNLIKTVLVENSDHWTPFYREFADFDEGEITLHFRGGKLSADTLLQNELIEWSPATSLPFTAVKHHEYQIETDQIELKSALPSTRQAGQTLNLDFIPKTSVRSEAALILPDGSVEKVNLSGGDIESPIKNQNNVSIFPVSKTPLKLSYKFKKNGLYFVEINNAEGLAMLNVPLYKKGTFPLIPNISELKNRESVDLGSDFSALRDTFLNLVNQERLGHQKSPIVLDDPLTQLAQFRAENMAKNDVFSHWDANGKTANDLRKNYGITQSISENLARDVNIELAHYGLMRSAIHRANVLSPEWTRVGIGLAQNTDGTYTFVQLFSEDPIDLSNPTALREQVLKAINDQRQGALLTNSTLESIAQDWSDSMVSADFFGFDAPDGGNLFDVLKAANVNKQIGTYIVGNTSFNDVLDQVKDNPAIAKTDWKEIGIGIAQDSVGIIKVTLIYSE